MVKGDGFYGFDGTLLILMLFSSPVRSFEWLGWAGQTSKPAEQVQPPEESQP